MASNYHIAIKKIRKKSGYSQEYVAKKINVARTTYVQIEKGERELNLSEAKVLSELFDITLEELLNGNTDENSQNKWNVEFKSTELNPEKKSSQKTFRINVPSKNLIKFKEILLYILEKVGAKPNIGETAIYKLLYFIDFDYYEKFEEQIIGATYIKNKYGPTPVEFIKIVENMQIKHEIVQIQTSYFKYEQKKYLPLRSADLSVLNARELNHIEDVLNRLSDKSAKELSEYSHSDIPWQIHEYNEKINYESVFYRDHEHSVRNFDDEL
jgi:DNA-binding XRE family transcriptional regulator